jgi:hypothetical protein
MSTPAPFVTSLRARSSTIRLAPKDAADTITLRVEMPEVWDVVRIEVLAADQVLEVKTRAIEALYPEALDDIEAYVVKLRGWEILDETQSLAGAGVIDGSILLITSRRRRPVR